MKNPLSLRDIGAPEPHSTGLSHGGDLEWALHGGKRQTIYSIPAQTRAEAEAANANEEKPRPFAHIMLPAWAREKAA